MTEAEWLASDDPGPMLAVARIKTGGRKLRLFAVACCRRVWDAVSDGEVRRAVEVAEGYVDKVATAATLRKASVAAARATADYEPIRGLDDYRANRVLTAAMHVCGKPARLMDAVACAAEAAADTATERAAQAALFRCLVANPFRPVAVEPGWRTETVLALAAGIYEERAFDRLPVLADALDDAGCDQPDVLGHLRGPGPHARGWWVVDYLLRKV